MCINSMFINQQGLFTTIYKDTWFRVLLSLTNITNKECHSDLDAVMIHYNKSGFAVKHIGCEGKFKSITDEVSNDMGI